MFLDREIKIRKQTFGIEIYDLMEELETSTDLTTDAKESKILTNSHSQEMTPQTKIFSQL